MADVELGSFDDIVEAQYVKFGEKAVRIRFTSSDFIIGENPFGNTTYTFAVVEGKEDKHLSVTSKRLMLKLKEHHPLVGKVLTINRIGMAMETDYTVELVKT